MSSGPHFIVIGAMKSATSTLHEQLAAQSGVFMTNPKEPNFFSDDEVYQRGLAWYERLFRDAPDGALCGESSTHYTKLPTHPCAVERIAMHCPNARFIYVMRHPIDRLVSHYIHEWTQRIISTSIDQAVESFPALVDYGCYAMQMRPYFDTFGRERVLPVFFDRLNSNPQPELERICRFIGYEGTPLWKSDLEAQNVSSERLRLSPVQRFLVDFPLFTWARRTFVPRALRDRVKSRVTMPERPQLSADVRTRIEAVFDRDLELLGNWLDIDLSCSTFKSATRDRSLEWTAAGRP